MVSVLLLVSSCCGFAYHFYALSINSSLLSFHRLIVTNGCCDTLAPAGREQSVCECKSECKLKSSGIDRRGESKHSLVTLGFSDRPLRLHQGLVEEKEGKPLAPNEILINQRQHCEMREMCDRVQLIVDVSG